MQPNGHFSTFDSFRPLASMLATVMGLDRGVRSFGWFFSAACPRSLMRNFVKTDCWKTQSNANGCKCQEEDMNDFIHFMAKNEIKEEPEAQMTQSLGESTMEEANARFIFSTLKKLASQGLSKLKDKVKAKMKNVVSTGLKSVVSLVIPKVVAFLIRQVTGFQDADKVYNCICEQYIMRTINTRFDWMIDAPAYKEKLRSGSVLPADPIVWDMNIIDTHCIKESGCAAEKYHGTWNFGKTDARGTSLGKNEEYKPPWPKQGGPYAKITCTIRAKVRVGMCTKLACDEDSSLRMDERCSGSTEHRMMTSEETLKWMGKNLQCCPNAVSCLGGGSRSPGIISKDVDLWVAYQSPEAHSHCAAYLNMYDAFVRSYVSFQLAGVQLTKSPVTACKNHGPTCS